MNYQKFINLLTNCNRHNAASKERRGRRQKLLLRVPRTDDERHRCQRIPGVRYARRGDVRDEAGDDTADSRAGPDGHTGR